MSDDRLKAMLDNVQRKSEERKEREKEEKTRRDTEIRAAGIALSERVMPRLRAAQDAWKEKLKLEIADAAKDFVQNPHSRTYPEIRVSVSAKAFASYVFQSHSPGYVSILNAAGRNKGNTAYHFSVDKIDSLTDETIDQVLDELLQIAHGFKDQ